MRPRNSLLFTEEDINKPENKKCMLKLMLIKVLINNQVTFEKFTALHREYCLRIGKAPHLIPSDRNNLIRVIIKKNKITYEMLETILRKILKLNPTGMSITLANENNERFLVSVEQRLF